MIKGKNDKKPQWQMSSGAVFFITILCSVARKKNLQGSIFYQSQTLGKRLPQGISAHLIMNGLPSAEFMLSAPDDRHYFRFFFMFDHGNAFI